MWFSLFIELIDLAIRGFSRRSVDYSATVRAAVELSRFVNLAAIHMGGSKIGGKFSDARALGAKQLHSFQLL
jgi:hypothetical protein